MAKDRKDKLLSRVHKRRIELDFRDRSAHSDNAIHCCRHCAGLFSEKVCVSVCACACECACLRVSRNLCSAAAPLMLPVLLTRRG